MDTPQHRSFQDLKEEAIDKQRGMIVSEDFKEVTTCVTYRKGKKLVVNGQPTMCMDVMVMDSESTRWVNVKKFLCDCWFR